MAWRQRLWRDAWLAGGIALFGTVSCVVLVGVGVALADGGPGSGGPWADGWAAVLAIGAAACVAAVGWYLARRLRDLERFETHTRDLVQAIAEAAESERARIGRNLHDDLGQHLTAIGMLSSGLRSRLNGEQSSWAEDAARLEQLAEEAGHRVRLLTRACLIDWTERVGLVRSIEMLCESASELLGVEVRAQIDERCDALDDSVASHLARIVNEALNNSIRHGCPRRVLVSLGVIGTLAADGSRSEAELRIENDGHGAEGGAGAGRPHAIKRDIGMGMSIMRARAEAIGGELEIGEHRGGGFALRCRFPATLRAPRSPGDRLEAVVERNAAARGSVVDRATPTASAGLDSSAPFEAAGSASPAKQGVTV